MIGADARQTVADLGAEDAVAKVVADAGPLSDGQRVALRGILLSPNAETASPDKLAATTSDHRNAPDDLGG
jgi:hypothetical protein